ncbi:hypothetical protein [Mucilaginibacter auburnensis]|uniref:Uncharacterized protein n=1 Tax=Mucilaginibacter auburnensis TaxID=1457233 RepID=A0A2H9VNR8_9SPHI|nr:hypothetical protein [Mucilaginibacter auburnensis]PJJ79961.1 hypothetical protein CLV57_3100 [Mucilaginibacter auburnensis]
MKILKGRSFLSYVQLLQFVDDNCIVREDIIAITQGGGSDYTIFFYADKDLKEKDRNFWGNLKED